MPESRYRMSAVSRSPAPDIQEAVHRLGLDLNSELGDQTVVR